MPSQNETLKDFKKIDLEDSWKTHLASEFEKPYMKDLKSFLLKEKDQGKIIFPRGDSIFSALNHTPLDKVKVVILGQDPYHGPGQAHGLSFSVPAGVPVPPSLVNIFKELETDLKVPRSKQGCLEIWADRGVLLLNSVLTVEQGKAASHQKKGWEQFTDAVIRVINEERENVAFILWGSYAQKKGAFIDRSRHFVLESPHPSPLSAHRGFLGSRPFSKVNEFLNKKGLEPVDWKLSP
jgi:uracil-DNA glycosylase